jgi:hypothetical protein
VVIVVSDIGWAPGDDEAEDTAKKLAARRDALADMLDEERAEDEGMAKPEGDDDDDSRE